MSAGGASRALSICVFCGSAESPPQVFVDTARHLGEELGRRGHRLIYGGAPIGLMGVVARAVQASGGSGLHRRPVALINVSNFWRPFLQQTRRMAILGFTGAGGGVLFRVAELAGRGIDLVETEVTRASALPVARFGLSTRSS